MTPVRDRPAVPRPQRPVLQLAEAAAFSPDDARVRAEYFEYWSDRDLWELIADYVRGGSTASLAELLSFGRLSA